MRLTKEELVKIMSKGWYTHDGMADGILAAEAAAEKAATDAAIKKARDEQRAATHSQAWHMFGQGILATAGGCTLGEQNAQPTNKQRFEALETSLGKPDASYRAPLWDQMEMLAKQVKSLEKTRDLVEQVTMNRDRLIDARLNTLERMEDHDTLHDDMIGRLEALEKRSEQTDSLRRTTSVGFSQRLDALEKWRQGEVENAVAIQEMLARRAKERI